MGSVFGQRSLADFAFMGQRTPSRTHLFAARSGSAGTVGA